MRTSLGFAVYLGLYQALCCGWVHSSQQDTIPAASSPPCGRRRTGAPNSACASPLFPLARQLNDTVTAWHPWTGSESERTGARKRPTGGLSRLRSSHAGREQAIEVLKDAFAQGRLDKDELVVSGHGVCT